MLPKVLIVDDKPENLIVLETILDDLNIEIVKALSGNDAITLSLDSEFALILMDVQMPLMDGYETVELLRSELKNKLTPVIFLSAIYSENEYLIKGIETGAVDFLIKPLIPSILRGKVKVFLEYYLQKKKLELHSQKTEEKNTELLVLNKKLNESEKLLKDLNYNKDILFSIIGHDLRGSVNSLLGYSELLSREFDEITDSEKKDIAISLAKISNNLSGLIENLLDWSRMQTGRIKNDPREINAKQKLDECSNFFEETLKSKNVGINITGDETSTIFVDEYMFNTIIRNLISNAIKFSNPNSKIEIIIESELNNTKTSIIDNGIGMTKQQIDDIFDIQNKKTIAGTQNESGTGLGLILCQDFIQKNQGELNIKSELGKGSTFTFLLPNKKIITDKLLTSRK